MAHAALPAATRNTGRPQVDSSARQGGTNQGAGIDRVERGAKNEIEIASKARKRSLRRVGIGQ